MRSISLIILPLLWLLMLIPSSSSEPNYLISDCTNTTFPANSLYKTNRNTVLNSLATHVASNHTRFGIMSSGNGTEDTVYGYYLCRGDMNASTCADCVTTATKTDLQKKYCTNSKVTVIWYDECTVRYSNESIFGKMETDPYEIYINVRSYNGSVVPKPFDTYLFKEVMYTTMNSMVAPTAKSGLKFTTKTVNFTESDTLYAMEQCAPDLTTANCTRCLTTAIGRLYIRKGCRVLQPSCHVRYETYPFYIGAANYMLSSPPSVVIGPAPHRNEEVSGKKKLSGKAIVAIVVPAVAISLALLATGNWLIKNRAKKYDVVAFSSVEEDLISAESRQYELATLQTATNNFSDDSKIGEGGFGIVYKGTLSDGLVIAVKRLSKSSGQGIQEFKNEVLVVAKLQHRNLTRLLGFCVAGEEKLLVYEYVPNRSLNYFLNNPKKEDHLDWGKRYNIIGGIARGMLYLHHDSRLRIIHRDLKPSNVLLDGDMSPKISDFGMAKIFGVEQTQGNTSRVVGTFGYMSPEYVMHGQFSVKSDVYSFGVLVLEIISGKRNSRFYESGSAEDLLSYVSITRKLGPHWLNHGRGPRLLLLLYKMAWKHWKNGTPTEFVDETIRALCPINQVKQCMHLGLLCVQESIDRRPTMKTVVLMLDSESVTLPMPQRPALFIRSFQGSKLGVGSDQSTSSPWSINEISISEQAPR